MNKLKTLKILCLILMAMNSEGQRIGFNCWWRRNKSSLNCVLARLDLYMKNLRVPVESKQVSCLHSNIYNATQFKDHVLDRTRDLEVIRLGYNKISEVPGDFFNQNLKLIEINMRNNHLTSIPVNLFAYLDKLYRVDMSNNMIKVLYPNTFVNNRKLLTLEMWNNQVETLPENIFRSTSSIERISFSCNNLQSLPDQLFTNTRQLMYLMLVNNNIKCLPTNIFENLINLELLNMGYNSLKQLPNGLFANNKNLKNLQMWANEFDCLPRNLFKNTSKLMVANFLLGNRGLPWSLRQRFANTQPYNRIDTLRRHLASYGASTCQRHQCHWDAITGTLDCSYRNLTRLNVRNDVCGSVRHLQLNGNQLNDAGEVKDFLQHYPDLQSVELQDNKFVVLDEEMFSGSHFLSFVDLSSNLIEEVPRYLFRSNLLLQQVRLSRNSISILHQETFEENDVIGKVDLSQNKLSVLNGNIFKQNFNLEDVDLSRNYIKQIPTSIFESNYKIKSIDLSYNQLNDVINLTSLRNKTELTSLFLQENRITEIITDTNGQVKMNELKLIELSGNRLNVIPYQLLELATSLERINLERNKITSIPMLTFSNNKKLKYLDLSYNRLNRIESEIFEFNVELEELQLDGNSLTELPIGLLRKNTDLRRFSASGNRIQSIPFDIFWMNIKLEEVNLLNNQIGKQGLPGNIFAGNPNIKTVSFAGNHLRELPEALFQGTPDISHVYLQMNRLRKLNRRTFETRRDLFDRSLLSTIINMNETDRNMVEILLQENLTQNKNQQKILTKLQNIDLRKNPELSSSGLDKIFTRGNIPELYNKLSNI